MKTLVGQAFPTYNQVQKEAEVLRRLIAGLDPFIRGKIHEQGGANIQGVVELVKNLERAQEHYQSGGYVFAYNPLMTQPSSTVAATPATVAQVESPQGSRKNEPSMQQLYDMIQELQVSRDSNRDRGYDRRRDWYRSKYPNKDTDGSRSYDRSPRSPNRDRHESNFRFRSMSRSPGPRRSPYD